MKKYKQDKENTPDLPVNPTRLAIFQCYDKDGIIDGYIPYLLEDLKENLSRLVVVVNGKLTAEGRRSLEALTSDVFVREDAGFDAAAWRTAMVEYLGWDQVAQYDELVLINDTVFGPFYPFREVFEEMTDQPVDFWGLTAHAESIVSYDGCPYPHIPVHIQPYFLVIRKKMHTSYEFKQYWETQPCFQTTYEVIAKNEIVFTKYFSDMGFTWAVLSDTSDLDGEYCGNGAVAHCWFSTYELIKNRRCPVLKRHCFGFDYVHQLNMDSGSQLKQSLKYIANETNYDVSLIYKNILRVYNIADIFNNLHLQYVLPKKVEIERSSPNYRAVMIFHISYMEKLDYLQPYINDIPKNIDVIITTKPKENINIVYQKFSSVLGDRLRIVPAKDPGRDLSALLMAAGPYLKGYDYIGFCHDKGPHKGTPITWSRDFQEIIIENIIGSGAYVENILSMLDEHPEIGFLTPPPPSYGPYFELFVPRYWGSGCINLTRDLAKKLKLNVDISENKWPLALGTAFWCRREALVPLFDYPWSYDDFPPEPMAVDGTLNHALERIFPFVAQHQGYLSGWVMTDEYAALEINNMHYRVDQLLHSSPDMPPLVQIGLKGALINYIKKHIPRPLWGVAKKIKHLLRW